MQNTEITLSPPWAVFGLLKYELSESNKRSILWQMVSLTDCEMFAAPTRTLQAEGFRVFLG